MPTFSNGAKKSFTASTIVVNTLPILPATPSPENIDLNIPIASSATVPRPLNNFSNVEAKNLPNSSRGLK